MGPVDDHAVPVFRPMPALPLGFPHRRMEDARKVPRYRFDGRYQRAGFAERSVGFRCR